MKKNRLRPLDRTRDQVLDTVLSVHGVPVQRVRQRAGKQDVILFRITQPIPHVPITSPLLELIFGDPNRYTGPACIPQPYDPWTHAGQNPTSGFNCHSFSLGTRIGLTPDDWVEGEPTDLAMDTNPTAILLSVYFRQVRIVDPTEVNQLVNDRKLRAGDVISFTYERPYWGTVHQHSGRVTRVEGENRIASKFQFGRLVVTSISEALQFYPETTAVRLYRFRGE